ARSASGPVRMSPRSAARLCGSVAKPARYAATPKKPPRTQNGSSRREDRTRAGHMAITPSAPVALEYCIGVENRPLMKKLVRVWADVASMRVTAQKTHTPSDHVPRMATSARGVQGRTAKIQATRRYRASWLEAPSALPLAAAHRIDRELRPKRAAKASRPMGAGRVDGKPRRP